MQTKNLFPSSPPIHPKCKATPCGWPGDVGGRPAPLRSRAHGTCKATPLTRGHLLALLCLPALLLIL
ncbi:MAG: hypothetical protein J2P36_30455, partial [Ktedonobacteraceae bacterium]|nr:hypothetical protein [Ktedonobacteraceae bacterium]